MQEWQRSPGEGRYARIEIERRFLVDGEVPLAGSTASIEDRYIDGTSLRLRRITVGGEDTFKLTHKVRPVPADPGTVSITNLYLTRDEYDLLAALPAAGLGKTRTVCPVGDARFAVDLFNGDLAGLRLAEIEVTDLADPIPRPAWLGTEVTRDDRFSGGRLARTSGQELDVLLADPAAIAPK